MLTLIQLIVRRTLRNAPISFAVLMGLLVLVTLLVAAPLYTTALANAGLQSALASAPLDQRSIRVWAQADQLDSASYGRIEATINEAAAGAAWLNPTILGSLSSKRLLPPGDDQRRRVVIAEATRIADNMQVVTGRLPRLAAADRPIEVVVSAETAERLGIAVGAALPLAETVGGAPVLQTTVVGVVEAVDRAAPFWQSGLLTLEPTWTDQQREATLVAASGAVLGQVVPQLPAGRASGSYGWRVLWDVSGITGRTADRADSAVSAVVRRISAADPTLDVATDFGGILADYQRRLAIARAPLLLLLSEIAGLALIYIAWTAAFQAEAVASEQSVMAARGASIRQILGLSSGQAGLLALCAALVGIPLTIALLQGMIDIGPVARQLSGVRVRATPDAGFYAATASLIGLLTLALPAIPAARRSIVALRQGSARPAGLPFWQRSYLDISFVVLAAVAFFQLQRQGTVLQQLRGSFEVDPFLLLAPVLLLMTGAFLILRAYLWLLSSLQSLALRLRGLRVSLALLHLSRNRAASTRLVLLLALAVALGVFAQTFGATLALNQQLRASYTVGAAARATIDRADLLLPGALPAGVQALPALRATVEPERQLRQNFTGQLVAVDPERFGAVAFNPVDQPAFSPAPTLAALGGAPAPDGIALPGQPRSIAVELERGAVPVVPAITLSDAVGRYLRYPLAPEGDAATARRWSVALDLPDAAYPLRFTTLALVPDGIKWGRNERSKDLAELRVGRITADDTVIEDWAAAERWQARPDTLEEAGTDQAGEVGVGQPQDGWITVQLIIGRFMRAALLQPDMHALDPVPVVVSDSFLQANRLAVGQQTQVDYGNRTLDVRIAGTAGSFPTVGADGAPFVVAHGPWLLRQLNASYDQPAEPNELWLGLPDDPGIAEQLRTTVGITGLQLATDVQQSYIREPLAVGIAGVVFLGFVTSIALAALGFGIATYLTGRRRGVEFAVLRALGLDRHDVVATLAIEQGILVALAFVAGAALGAALSRLILPFMAISDRGRAAVPPYVVVAPWSTLALTYAALAALFALVLALVLALLLRRGIGNALRIGEE